MFKAQYVRRDFIFKEAGGTSRGVLRTKPSWLIKISSENGDVGIGECSIIPGLSIEDSPLLEKKIEEVCADIEQYANDYQTSLVDYPGLRFALETAFTGLANGSTYTLFDSDFVNLSKPITINGLIWMGEQAEMLKRIEEKLSKGFKCLKLKVGAIDFNKELELLSTIRKNYSAKELELRVDANGAFSFSSAMDKLNALAKYDIHSIEQPIAASQYEAMYHLCQQSPIAVALDEELIGIKHCDEKRRLLETIQPQYIILKPSLIGGFKSSNEWIELAEQLNIGWWATSALESNIGLNAIAQWVYTKNNSLRQGLGTGQVFTNNIKSPLYLDGDQLYYGEENCWENPFSN
ncbi:o-succinylbenzoate synthase [Carboxylicivirga marina]|uniref:o-succinylbenzoate synthase n=1 Tax=Carboxylicivirga marina TaxID=2800988 RepID=UPI00259628F2|nr:o-succinylbenzoate synthase [uncultured Carboxylicivirga sp.]